MTGRGWHLHRKGKGTRAAWQNGGFIEGGRADLIDPARRGDWALTVMRAVGTKAHRVWARICPGHTASIFSTDGKCRGRPGDDIR